MTALPPKPSSLPAKITVDTRFFIDYDWWKRNVSEDLDSYLRSHLSPEQRDRLPVNLHDKRQVDFIDPETGEVSKVDELGQALRIASHSDDFFKGATILDGVFRVFIRNNNTPTTITIIAKQLDADPKVVLDLLRKNVYKGLKPYV